MNVIAPISCFGNVSYYAHLIAAENFYVENHENFGKQSFRNRFEILGANNVQSLSIPVIKKSGIKQAITKVEISYAEDWNVKHWRSIRSAYASSPFFEHYDIEIEPLFAQKFKNLFEWNTKCHEIICDILQIENKAINTSKFNSQFDGVDLRNSFKKRNENNTIKHPKYNQVFDDRFNFEPNLSILDLIFNQGNMSLPYLEAIAAKIKTSSIK